MQMLSGGLRERNVVSTMLFTTKNFAFQCFFQFVYVSVGELFVASLNFGRTRNTNERLFQFSARVCRRISTKSPLTLEYTARY